MLKHKSILILLLWSILCWTVVVCHASGIEEEVTSRAKDSEESAGVFKKERRFVPVPIPVSDPTIGTGLAVAGLYLHPRREGDTVSPTSISGVFGMYTDTDSWMAGVFHEGFYSEDRYRVRSTLGYGEFNLKFYGVGDDSFFRDNPIDYKAEGIVFIPRVLFRLPFNNWFLGPRYYYLNIDTSFDFSNLLPGLPAINATTSTAGLGIVALYDSRDNNLWASSGSVFEAIAMVYGEGLGGDFDYQKYMLRFTQFFPVTDRITLAYRLDGQFIDGDAPFYDLSILNLRGFPTGRYINDHAVTGQVEGRWNFYKRWTGLIFGGAGRTAEEVNDLGSAPTRYAGGVGIRYMIVEEQKLNIGIDITYGDDKVEVYVQIGDWLAN
jgi:hypothetical protein